MSPTTLVLHTDMHTEPVCPGHVGMVVKVLFMLSLELVAIPIAYGAWIDVCTLPVVVGSASSRLAFLRAAPVAFAALHWLLGMAWIIGIAAFLNIARSVLRPGACVWRGEGRGGRGIRGLLLLLLLLLAAGVA